jgi:hypothetical protein
MKAAAVIKRGIFDESMNVAPVSGVVRGCCLVLRHHSGYGLWIPRTIMDRVDETRIKSSP